MDKCVEPVNVAPPLMRDAVIDEVFAAAKRDRDIFFISADLGAKALDRFRDELPEQFLHVGICEQNMVDLASGLALSGKKVFLYAMAPFITARCYEQVKCVVSSMELPVTLIAVGVGLGYDHATLTHFTPEDIACMRVLNGIEVLTPCDVEAATKMAQLCISTPSFRYLRLERQAQMSVYSGRFSGLRDDGVAELATGQDVAIVACGYLTHKALAAREILARDHGISAGVIDLFQVKPLKASKLISIFDAYSGVVTVEEQFLAGGMGSAVIEALADGGCRKPISRLGIQDGFEVVNGNRDQLHAVYGIDTPSIVTAAVELSDA